MSFIAIIPARFASSRLPGKPLADINGKPMVVHVMEKAKASGANQVIVATDHSSVVKVIKKIGGEVYLTKLNHKSGSDRLQEVVNYYNFHKDQIIINLQVDEPLIPAKIIQQVANDLTLTNANIATLATPITTEKEAHNPNIVKVVLNSYGYALYFSRKAIPWNLEKFSQNFAHPPYGLLRHIGIYAYRADFIRRHANWPLSPLEKSENLEQLRVLWYGGKIYVRVKNITSSISVDTIEELAQVRLLQKQLEE